MTQLKFIGKSFPRLDAKEKVTGQAVYSTDLRLPGMLYGRILRSPHPHARIIHISTERAERLVGVKAVVTAADTPKIKFGPLIEDRYPLAVDKVRFVGDELAAVAANPGLQRSLALYRLDMRTEGTREWNWTIRGMDDRTLLAAAELARRNEVWDRSINTADRTVVLHDYALRYPAPYAEVLIAQARSHELEEHWVLGLVRQESRFIASAKSSAGASGLMQLMPATARWVARKIGLRDYSWSRVTDVVVNATLGTAYLKHVLADVDGSPVVAAAGYNAGPRRAHRWRDARPIEGAIYAESIPFNETRDYVKKVMANTVLYSAVLGGSMRTLKERLGVIAPRSSIERIAVVP